MRKRRTKLNRPLPPLKLYLDDIEEIVQLIDAAGAGSVEISTEDYEMDDVEDLRNLGHRWIRTLQVRSDHPNIVVNFGPSASFIEAPADTPELTGVATHIAEALAKRRRRFYYAARKDSSGSTGSKGEITNYTKIFLRRRAEEANFWARNGDQIILTVFGYALGFGSAFLLAYLTG
jgi:hypothetical protein